MTNTLEYEADGLRFFSQLHWPAEGKPRAAVLVFPEAGGLNAHCMGAAERLAREGYVALACDLHGDAQEYDNLPDVVAVLGPIVAQPSRLRARGLAALEALHQATGIEFEKTAAIGFCLGGTIALEIARSDCGVVAAVGFHSGLVLREGDAPKGMSTKVLVCIGSEDPHVPADQRRAFEEEMRSAGADWMLSVYGGVGHGFTNPTTDALSIPGFAYDAAATEHSWNEMQRLFDRVLS